MRMTRKAMAAVAVAVLMAGCGSSQEGAGGDGEATAGGDGAQGTQAVRVVLPHAGIFTVGLPYAVAKENGFFADNGLEVTPIFTSGGGANVQAVVSGSAEIGVETGPAAIFAAAANDAPVRLVAASTTGMDILFFSKGGSPYTDVESLSGQKVGISAPGSSTDFALSAINEQMESAGLDPAEKQPLGSPPEQLAAVETDQVAAGWTVPPTFLDKVDSGELQIAANTFEDLPEYQEVIGRATFTTAPFLEENPEAVSGFLKAWQQAWDWAFENQDEAIEMWRKEAQLQVDPATLKKSFDYYQRDMFDGAVRGVETALEDSVAAGGKPLSPEQLDELVADEAAQK